MFIIVPFIEFLYVIVCFDSMSSNQLGDVGIVVLAQALKVNPILHTLR